MKTAVLLVNLGSPSEPTVPSIAAYLREFLSDRRVVDLPALIWQPILRGIILRRRPAKLVPKYQAIWRTDGAPLKAITSQQARSLGKRLQAQDIAVYWAMRYQEPAITDVWARMRDDGVECLVLLPMYPQFSHTTTSTVTDEVTRIMATQNSDMHVRTINHYHDESLYIEALKNSVLAHWQTAGRPDFANGERMVLSFHGLPERNIQRGDPYQAQCERTAQLLTEALGLTPNEVKLAYQSRFGAQKWLQPSTQATLEQLAAQQCTRVDVLCPGFAADCLETLEEIAIDLKAIFEQAGGQNYHYIPCLNDDSAHINMMQHLVETALQSAE